MTDDARTPEIEALIAEWRQRAREAPVNFMDGGPAPQLRECADELEELLAVLGRRSPQPVSATSEEVSRAGESSGDSSRQDLPRPAQS